MKKFTKISLGILIVITIMGCPAEDFPENDSAIELINNSDEDIIWFGYDHLIISDTSQLNGSFPWREVENDKIVKGASYSYKFYSGNMKDLLNEGFIQFYYLNYDTVLTVPWERIRDENIILKKVYFETWEEMEVCNFTITYP